nr:hypothetical protein [Catenibacterium mitsuokai]
MRKHVYNIFNSYFTQQLLAYCYEQLLQLQIVISGVVYILTGKEINSFQSKLFLILGTVTVIVFGMVCPVNYYAKIISLLYKTAKQYKLLYMAYKEADRFAKIYRDHHPERTDDDIKNFKRRSLEMHYRDLQEKSIIVQVRELDESDVPEAIREQIRKQEAQM